jgi:hypothetical protein
MVTGLSKPYSITMSHLNLTMRTAEEEIDLQLFMQEKLARAIDKKMNSKISSKSRTTKDVKNLESCYEK